MYGGYCLAFLLTGVLPATVGVIGVTLAAHHIAQCPHPAPLPTARAHASWQREVGAVCVSECAGPPSFERELPSWAVASATMLVAGPARVATERGAAGSEIVPA